MSAGHMDLNGGREESGPGGASRGKATVLALGKAFPGQVLLQEHIVNSYLHNTNCDDAATREKLERLCKHPLF